jgi:hypothetical protein
MEQNPEIKYLKSNEINRALWDACINTSPNGVVYATSWFLDRICSNWDALVWGNYQYVMPLVFNRKFGISYIYQPFFTQQLGVFSPFPVSPEIVNLFLSSIPKKFKLVESKLNLGNLPTSNLYDIKPHTTYLLPLENTHDQLQAGYSEYTRRNLSKAQRNRLQLFPVYQVDEFVRFTTNNWTGKVPGIKPSHWNALQKIINHAISLGCGYMRGVFDQHNNMIAATFLLFSGKKIINLVSSSSEEGFNQKAMFLLLDSVFQEYAGSDLVFDFEGSDIPGIARFFEGFGGAPHTYFSVRRNNLPSILKIIKK